MFYGWLFNLKNTLISPFIQKSNDHLIGKTTIAIPLSSCPHLSPLLHLSPFFPYLKVKGGKAILFPEGRTDVGIQTNIFGFFTNGTYKQEVLQNLPQFFPK